MGEGKSMRHISGCSASLQIFHWSVGIVERVAEVAVQCEKLLELREEQRER